MTIIFYLQCKVQKYSGKFMISVCLKMKIGGFGNCWLFSKNLFCGHTTPTSITCDWIIHTYGCMWGDRKGRLFRQTLENCCGFAGVAKYRNKKKNLTFLLKTRQLSLRIINIHFWLKNSNRRHKIYFAHRSYAKKTSATLY